MSNHFTGLSLGPPLGDQRLDLCDLYAFQSPADKNRTVIILNANPNADALHPDAIYRVNIDNNGDYLTDIAFSYIFSKPQNGRQTVDVFMATGAESRSVEAVGKKIIADAEVSFGAKPNIIRSGPYTFFAGSRSDAFFFDFDGIKNLFDISGKRNFTEPHLGASRHGPAWIRTQRRTWVRPRSSCRRVKSIPSLRCTSGAGAVCDATASCFTSIAPAIRA
jgi:hypothetical protein